MAAPSRIVIPPPARALVADGVFARSGLFYVLPDARLKPLEELFQARVITLIEQPQAGSWFRSERGVNPLLQGAAGKWSDFGPLYSFSSRSETISNSVATKENSACSEKLDSSATASRIQGL